MSEEIVTSADWSEEDEKQSQEELKAMAAAEAAGNPPTEQATVAKTPEELQAEADAAKEQEEAEAKAKAEAEAAAAPAEKPDDTAEQQKAQLAAEIEELRKRKRDLAGEVGGELDRRARQQNAELQAALQQTRAELDALKAANRPAPAQIDDKVLFDGLDDAQKDPNDPVVAMAAKMTRNAVGHLAKRLEEENERREKAMQTQIAQAHIDRFTDSVESIEPGFRKVNGYDGNAPDPEWAEHVNARRPGMAVSWRQYIEMAESPTEAAAEAFRALKAKNGGGTATPPVKKPVADPSTQVSPQRSTVSPRVDAKGSPSPMDQLNQIQKDYENDKITEEEFEKRSGPLLVKLGLRPR